MTKFVIPVLAFLLLTVGLAFGDPCPLAIPDPTGTISGTGAPGNTAYETNAATQGNCNLIITFNADSSIVTTIANSAPYDGVEDQLIGVVNNTSSPIMTIALSNPGVRLFGFDADGICAFQPFAANGTAGLCNGSTTASTTDPGDYLGTASSFSNISAGLDSGSVNWANGIAAGTTGYFSLEEPASLNLVVNNQVPEPTSILLLGSALLGLSALRRRKSC